MITLDQVRQLALSFPESTEEPHFEKISFRVKKKIFATYDPKQHTATIKLSLTDQDVFCSGSNNSINPVDNKWGKQGWTSIQLENVHPDLFKDGLTTAYCEVASPKLADLVRNSNQ